LALIQGVDDDEDFGIKPDSELQYFGDFVKRWAGSFVLVAHVKVRDICRHRRQFLEQLLQQTRE
jgi:hypothetical protein